MISAIIPTYNRADMLAKMLPTYIACPSLGEVIIVDDGSQDRTIPVVEEFARRDGRIRLIKHESNKGRTVARNHAIDNARGDLILNSEDDLAVTDVAIRTLLEHMQAAKADIVAGRRIWMRFGETEEQALARADRHPHPVINRKLLDTDSQAITPTDVEIPLLNATMLVRREVFDEVRFQDCYRSSGWREDSDVQIGALELGYKVIFCPHAVFFHHDRTKAGLGKSRLKSDLEYLRSIYENDLIFLKRHQNYLRKEIPESLLFGSPTLSALRYVVVRSAWLARSELRRIWQSRSHS
jgi:GT2 family glycosyltransferase